MTDQSTGFRFDIYERVHLPDDKPGIGELEQIELLPHVKGIPGQEQTQLKGHLHLTAVYAPDEEGTAKQSFEHFIPVEITLPVRAKEPYGEIQVQIDQFDVEPVSKRSLNVTGVLSLSGWNPLPAGDSNDGSGEEIVAIHHADGPTADSIALKADPWQTKPFDGDPGSGASGTEPETAEPVLVPEAHSGFVEDKAEELRDEAGGKTAILQPEREAIEPEEEKVEPKVAFKPQLPAETDNSLPERNAEKTNNTLEWRKLFLGGDEEVRFRKMRMCIVQKQETIQSIAERYQLNSREIALYNRLGESDVSAGQIIYIPLK